MIYFAAVWRNFLQWKLNYKKNLHGWIFFLIIRKVYIWLGINTYNVVKM